jgi:transaldolase
MKRESYFEWLVGKTPTTWWHDSADPGELTQALANGADGVTTNPMLCSRALASNRELWAKQVEEVLSTQNEPVPRASSLVKIVVGATADRLRSLYTISRGKAGFVCAQVNPSWAGDREAMFRMAKEFSLIAPNIAVKLPVTAAGLDVLELCVAEGINVTATVSFSVPQVLAVAESHRAGVALARSRKISPGRCFAVIMIGRLDDYIRDVAKDRKSDVAEKEIVQAGLAITKRAYALFRERRYEAVLLVAALRGTYHLTELAGAELVMSIAPMFQNRLAFDEEPRECLIQHEVPRNVIDHLLEIPEFRRAYEPNGMQKEDFLCFGATQRTLSQFIELGWNQLERYGVPS